jgi:hypothetical protein
LIRSSLVGASVFAASSRAGDPQGLNRASCQVRNSREPRSRTRRRQSASRSPRRLLAVPATPHLRRRLRGRALRSSNTHGCPRGRKRGSGAFREGAAAAEAHERAWGRGRRAGVRAGRSTGVTRGGAAGGARGREDAEAQSGGRARRPRYVHRPRLGSHDAAPAPRNLALGVRSARAGGRRLEWNRDHHDRGIARSAHLQPPSPAVPSRLRRLLLIDANG